MTANTGNSETGGAKNESGATGRTADDVRRDFSSLPFDQKLLTLARVEFDMLGDAVEAVASAVSSALDDVANVCAGHTGSTRPDKAGETSTS